MEQLEALFKKIKKQYEKNPDKTLKLIELFVKGDYADLETISSIAECSSGMLKITKKDKVFNINERLRELSHKFSKIPPGMWSIFQNVEFQNQSKNTGTLYRVTKPVQQQVIIKGLGRIQIEKKFELPDALAFAEILYDQKLIASDHQVSIQLASSIKTHQGRPCTITVTRYFDENWELYLHGFSGEGTYNTSHYLLCK
jgi:hypothetical protein